MPIPHEYYLSTMNSPLRFVLLRSFISLVALDAAVPTNAAVWLNETFEHYTVGITGYCPDYDSVAAIDDTCGVLDGSWCK